MSLFTEIILDRLIKYFTFSGFIYDFMLTSSAMHCGNLNYCMVANIFEKFEIFSSILERIQKEFHLSYRSSRGHIYVYG